ncbi:Ig-like domain-containing protein [Actinoplanes sp. NPDC026623]|uniref:Ig-like domain-containing protein n=1 Tax=Actinoplanes sp. NPDC026623 TaxID=3155610 RepID=UPI0033FDA1E7
MHAPSRIARRLGVSATAALSLVLTGTAPALAEDTTPLDTTPPVITSTGLTDGQTVLRQSVLHPVVTDDVAVTTVLARAGAGSFSRCTVDASQGLSCSVTIPVALNGTDIDMTVRAFDAAGNRADRITRVHVVAVALSGVLAPKAGTAMRSGPRTATLSDVSTETSKIEMTEGSTGAVLATLTAEPWTFTWNASATATPPCFRLSEPAGNSTTYCSNYVVSDEAPVIASVWAWHEYGGDEFGGKLAWSSRLDQGTGWIGADGTITSSPTDKTGIDHTELWVDGVLRSSTTAQSAFFDWHDATRGKAFANLQVRVMNRVGLTTTKAFRLNIDNVGPVLRISPRAGTLLRGKQVTVTKTATDQHRIVPPESAGFSTPWQASPLSYSEYVTLHGDGSIRLRFSVYDELGNPSALSSLVTVDNTKATVGFATAPKNKAKVKGTVKVTAKASDKYGVARVQLLINGKVVATDTSAAFKFSINTKKYGKKIKVGLRAYDKAGNVTTTSTRTWYRR